MKRGVSRTQWVALAGSLLACAAALTTRQRFPLLRLGADAEFATLLAERDALRANDDRVRDELRAQVRVIPTWSASRIEALRQAFGPAWRWDFHHDNPALRAVTLTRPEARASDWSAIVAALGTLERQPGIVIREVEVVEAPARPRGGFSHVRIELAWLP